MDTVQRLMSEKLQGLASLACTLQKQQVGPEGKAITSHTLWRWCKKGIRLPDGRRLKMEHVLLAGRFLSSPQAFERFIAAQSPDAPPMPAAVRSPGKREQSSEKAGDKLAEIGI